MKKTIFKLAVLIMAVVLISGCNVLFWKRYTSPEGRFSVQLPAQPPEGKKVILDTDFGRTYLNVFMLSRDEDKCVYSVAYVDYAAGLLNSKTADKILDDGVDGAVKNIQGLLIKQSKISLKKYPGREIAIEAPGNVIIKARFFLVGNRMYQLMATTDKKWAGSYNVRRFLNSFKIL